MMFTCKTYFQPLTVKGKATELSKKRDINFHTKIRMGGSSIGLGPMLDRALRFNLQSNMKARFYLKK
ncbi:hypothetical protein LEP1GSC081_1409 [Leptospira kirschneri str. H1]|uniref:Uncharacterized protein n=1 Tax=Leptospira kirschneri str. H1 TaxID=1049966 RepID=A0A0E2B0Y8_9LEPT|nr:hypothetical protein LEP1GSC081_1409 [Leptospira kirschneri str. H1]